MEAGSTRSVRHQSLDNGRGTLYPLSNVVIPFVHF